MIREFAIGAGRRLGIMSTFSAFAFLLTSPGFFSISISDSENTPGMTWGLVLPGAVRLAIVVGAAWAGLMLPELYICAAWACRSVRGWSGPLLTLAGAVFLAVPAVLFPPRARRLWLGEVLESFAFRRDHDTNWFMVFASYVRTWPSDLLDEWLTYLKRLRRP